VPCLLRSVFGIICSCSGIASIVAPELEGIQDMTETDLINLRRTIYLTLMNSLGFEEAVHKLMNISVPEGKEVSSNHIKRKYRF